MADQKWVAYVDLGNGPGTFVDPEALGGEDSDNFRYLVEHRVVVPLGDPDAAIAMGTEGALAAAAVDEDVRNQEIQALKDRIKELEDAAAQHQENVKEAEKASSSPSSPSSTPTAGPSSATSGPSSPTPTRTSSTKSG